MKKMKQRMMAKASKIVASILVTAMAVSLIPKIMGTGTVFAAGSKNTEDTCLGTTGIAAPTSPASADAAWQGSYVYFGTYGGNPIKFRVLAPSTTAYGGSTMFLDSDVTLFNDFFDNTSPYFNAWDGSDIQGVLNGTFLTGFTSLEQEAIATSTGNGGLTYDSFLSYMYGSPVSVNDRVFLLDAAEVMNPAYGYSSDCGWVDDDNDGDWSTVSWNWHEVANREKGGSSANWWLRSADTDYSDLAGGVSDVGFLGDIDVYSLSGVAPALNINQSSIIFSSLISGSFNTAGAEYKLTIADDNLAIAVPAGQEVTATGTTITVPYQIGGTDAGTATRASVLILDKAYGTSGAQILYYDALGGTFSNSAAASGTFTLPTTLDIADWGTDYYVYILAEDVNGEKETDYASTPVAIDAPAGAIATNYTVTYSVVNGTWSDGTTADKTETVASGASPASIPTGMIASSGYTGGSWDTDPASATITGNTTFTYTFEAIPTYTVTYSVANGTWSDGTTADKTETVQSGSAPANVPTGMIAASGYTGGSWDTDPASAAITGNTTFTYTFEAIPTYTVTYSVANGTWSDGTTADKTETVQSGSAPASVPTGMIASSGYTGGSWDTDPASATITGNTTFTYTFEAIPVYYTVAGGGNSTFMIGDASDLVITVKRNVADDTCFSHFTGVEIDGKALVSGTDFTAVAGSTVVTINAATLNKLTEGGHIITIVFDDGKIETSVTAKAASGTSNGGSAVPSTGESLAPTLFIGIAFVAVAGTLFTVMLVQKKRKSVR